MDIICLYDLILEKSLVAEKYFILKKMKINFLYNIIIFSWILTVYIWDENISSQKIVYVIVAVYTFMQYINFI